MRDAWERVKFWTFIVMLAVMIGCVIACLCEHVGMKMFKSEGCSKCTRYR